MEKELIKVSKYFKEKKYSYLYIIFFLLAIITYLLSNKDKIIKILSVIKDLLEVFRYHVFSLGVCLFFYISIKKIFRYSNKESQKDIDCINKPMPHIIENKYIDVELIERINKYLEETTLEINIKNKHNERIMHLIGYLYLYDKKKRIKKVNINIENLNTQYRENVFFDVLQAKELYWNECDLFIEKLEYKDIVEEKIYDRGTHFIRTFVLELNYNKYYDNKILGIKTKYNLIYLKEKFKLLKRAIVFYWRINEYSFNKKIKITRKKIFIRIIIILLISVFISLIIVIIPILILDLFNFAREIIQLYINS